MTERQTFARALTEREMERLEARVTGSIRDAEQVIIEFYDIALAERGSSFEEETTIRPTEFSIPEDQWLEIASWLNTRHPLADGASFNGALSWMNSGPSSHHTIEEAADG